MGRAIGAGGAQRLLVLAALAAACAGFTRSSLKAELVALESELRDGEAASTQDRGAAPPAGTADQPSPLGDDLERSTIPTVDEFTAPTPTGPQWGTGEKDLQGITDQGGDEAAWATATS